MRVHCPHCISRIISDDQLLLRPLNEIDVPRIIEELAKAVGLRFEDRLVKRILNDLNKALGGLPLLEGALTKSGEGSADNPRRASKADSCSQDDKHEKIAQVIATNRVSDPMA